MRVDRLPQFQGVLLYELLKNQEIGLPLLALTSELPFCLDALLRFKFKLLPHKPKRGLDTAYISFNVFEAAKAGALSKLRLQKLFKLGQFTTERFVQSAHSFLQP